MKITSEHIISNKETWETRSKIFQNNLKSVLFRRFPDSLNGHLHELHKQIILENTPDKDNLQILDVGCGFGRNSLYLIDRNSKTIVTGIDISQNFVDLFKANTTQSAFCGTLEEFPDNLGKFDFILCITVLMYVEKENLNLAIQNMLSHLKSGGKIILIEPLTSGHFFSSGFGILNFFRMKQTTSPGNHFKSNYLIKNILACGGQINEEKRLPVTTIFIIPLYFLASILPDKLLKIVFLFFRRLDNKLGHWKLPSMYTALIIQQKQ